MHLFVLVEAAHSGMLKDNSKQIVWRGYLVCTFKSRSLAFVHVKLLVHF